MITTSTGAKKLESSDNWREIFPNPGTSAAGAHNASVDAQDRIQAEVAPIINGKRCSLGAASGEYVLLRNSTIAGKTDGAYVAAKAIPANTDLDSTYLGSPITGGMVNELNSKLTNLDTVTTPTDISFTAATGVEITGQYFTKWGRLLIGAIEYNLTSQKTIYNRLFTCNKSFYTGAIITNQDSARNEIGVIYTDGANSGIFAYQTLNVANGNRCEFFLLI